VPEAPVCDVFEDVAHLLHFDHEAAAVGLYVVPSADSCKKTIHNPAVAQNANGKYSHAFLLKCWKKDTECAVSVGLT
jgi:hypothetical protein